MNTKHVPDLELCQELDQLCKEKNITIPETEYQWALVNFSKSNEDWEWEMHHKDHFPSNWSNKNHIPAPLVSEQGDWLPNERRDKLAFFSGLAINGWFCEVKNYRVMPYERFHVILQEDTEANARMKCLLYLLENDIIDGNAFN